MVAPSLQKNRLIVFGRYPRVGTTKTRLIPTLGPAGAAALQKRLTERTVAAAGQAAKRNRARLIFCHDGGDPKKIVRWLTIRKNDCVPQAEGDLGRRMRMAMHTAFRQGARRVVLVGTDIPGLTEQVLGQAFDRLKQHDLVLGPSTDGGYWLVGLTRPENIFDGIAWSTPAVLEQTLERARRRAMTVDLLEAMTDLDTPDDLARFASDSKSSSPYLSVVIPTLNEEERIDTAISGATNPDTEVILSDGGSTDRTVEIARSMGARIVQGRPGRACQQNRGAAAARGEVLLFLHADTRLPRNFVAHIFDTLMDRCSVLGAFRFETDRCSPAMRLIGFLTNRRAAWLSLPYGDQGLFLRRGDFQRVGGFPDVPIAEDLFLVRTMARSGCIRLAPAAVITSARRWQRLGALRTTLINIFIAAGCLAGVAPQRLAPLYRWPVNHHE